MPPFETVRLDVWKYFMNLIKEQNALPCDVLAENVKVSKQIDKVLIKKKGNFIIPQEASFISGAIHCIYIFTGQIFCLIVIFYYHRTLNMS